MASKAGGRTFTAGEGDERCLIQWAPAGRGRDLLAGAGRLARAGQCPPGPRPLAGGGDAGGCWLVTAALPGGNAVSGRRKPGPAAAVTAVGEGPRARPGARPAARCPFWRSAGQRLPGARRHAAAGRPDPAAGRRRRQGLTVRAAVQHAAATPPPASRHTQIQPPLIT